jgi:ABC-type multidrug transport system ATPase subunit
VVGERGQALSGGERQRISIARALLIDPRVLILDEATSSVDTTTEIEIQQALENLIRGRTTIAVAHRLSTLRRADRLVVLDRGVVVEEGGHDELMRRDGAYRKLYDAQARQAATEAAIEAAAAAVAAATAATAVTSEPTISALHQAAHLTGAVLAAASESASASPAATLSAEAPQPLQPSPEEVR